MLVGLPLTGANSRLSPTLEPEPPRPAAKRRSQVRRNPVRPRSGLLALLLLPGGLCPGSDLAGGRRRSGPGCPDGGARRLVPSEQGTGRHRPSEQPPRVSYHGGRAAAAAARLDDLADDQARATYSPGFHRVPVGTRPLSRRRSTSDMASTDRLRWAGAAGARREAAGPSH
jgi:hypothetical protein